MPCGACSPCRSASWACWVTCAASTCSSSRAARPTSRPGWPARGPTRWPSTSRASSWPPPAGSSAGSARPSRWCRATSSGCRSPTGASTSSSASTAPRRGATPSAGCPRRPGCCDPVGAWCSSPTATCPRCACRPTRGSRGSGCCAGTRRPTACSGRAGESSTTRRTATGCDSCAGGVRRRGAARDLRPGRPHRPPVLRDRLPAVGEPLARRGALGGAPRVGAP